MRKSRAAAVTVITIITILWIPGTVTGAQNNKFEKWGRETLEVIERDHSMDAPGAYYEDHRKRDVSYTWGISMLLLAYSRAAEVDSEYIPCLERLIEHQNKYWVVSDGIGGYDHLPHPKQTVERYYDDNAWVAMALVEAYKVTGKDKYLQQAKKTIQFSLSGRDESGGIWWREDPKETFNTCSVAPTAFACLSYYEVTNEKYYLKTAVDLMKWLDRNLKDDDSLYMDNITPSGRIERTKWTYNSGMPLQNYVKLYNLTGRKSYLEKAKKIAQAAEDYWYDPDTGALDCKAMFGWTLIEGWLELSKATGNPHWKNIAQNSMSFVYNQVRGPQGRYPDDWDTPTDSEIKRWKLLYPSGTARAYWVLAAADNKHKQNAPKK